MTNEASNSSIDFHERSPLRPQPPVSTSTSTSTSTSETPLRSAPLAAAKTTIPRPNFFNPSRARRWSSLALKATPLILLVYWSTLVFSFRSATNFFDPATSSRPRPWDPGAATATSQKTSLRGKQESLLYTATIDSARDKGLSLSLTDFQENDGPMPLEISLWLLPDGGPDDKHGASDGPDVYANTKEIIDELAKAKKSPRFNPHVTLGGSTVASRDEAMAVAETLRAGLKGLGAIECFVGDTVLSGPNSWNQALVLGVVPPLDGFLEVCKTSRKLMGSTRPNDQEGCLSFPPPLNVPHMSLYYGDAPPDPAGIDLERIFGSSSSDKKSFMAHRVELWATDPLTAEGVPEWKLLAGMSLL